MLCTISRSERTEGPLWGFGSSRGAQAPRVYGCARLLDLIYSFPSQQSFSLRLRAVGFLLFFQALSPPPRFVGAGVWLPLVFLLHLVTDASVRSYGTDA